MSSEADGPDGAGAVEHLQAAARELIQATRAVLDAAEELVDDPESIRSLLGTLGDVARSAARGGSGATPKGDDEDGPSKVTRIDVE